MKITRLFQLEVAVCGEDMETIEDERNGDLWTIPEKDLIKEPEDVWTIPENELNN